MHEDLSTKNANAGNENVSFDPYVSSCYKSFTQHQKIIILDSHLLYQRNDYDLNEMFMKEMKIYSLWDNNKAQLKCLDYLSKKNKLGSNLPKLVLFKVFANAEKLIIFSTQKRSKRVYPFSFVSFLRLLKETVNIKEAQIRAYRPEEYDEHGGVLGATDSWLSILWKQHDKKLIEIYNNIGYERIK